MFVRPEIVNSAELQQLFPRSDLSNDKKCTNIAKFIFNIFLPLIHKLEFGFRYTRWIGSITRYYEK